MRPPLPAFARLLICCLGGILASLSVAAAQDIEVSGTITGTIDGVPGEWSTLQLDGMGSTANYSSFMPGFTGYTIQGHIGKTPALDRAVAITFTRMENGTITEPNVLYLHKGTMSEFFESAEGAVQITFDTFVEEPDLTTISGTVTGTVRPVSARGLEVDDDPASAIEVELTFDTKAYPES